LTGTLKSPLLSGIELPDNQADELTATTLSKSSAREGRTTCKELHFGSVVFNCVVQVPQKRVEFIRIPLPSKEIRLALRVG